jgi:beta-N-acetylhexosaminidase
VTPTTSPAGTLTELAHACVLSSFAGTTAPDWALRRAESGLGGFVLFGANFADVAAVTSRLRSVAPDLLIATDEEGGDVTRLDADAGSPFPGNAALGVIDDVTLTERAAAAIGGRLLAAGVDLDLAPCADVNSNPANPVIGVRSFGADPGLVGRHVAAYVRGLQAAGVAACAKHFPGHGDTADDSHLGLPRVDAPVEVLRARELVPFESAIAAGTAAIMTSHVVLGALDPSAPATFSRAALVRLLRDELGFDGVVVTDALDMGAVCGDGVPAAAVRSIVAGADLLCLGSHFDDASTGAVVDALASAVHDGTLPESRLADAAARVASLRSRHASSRQLRTSVPETNEAEWVEVAGRALAVEGALPHGVDRAVVVELHAPASIAVGDVPWGLAPHAGGTGLDVAVLHEDDHPARALAAAKGRPLVVVVRDVHRHGWQLDVLTAIAARRPDLVTVDMGWPSPAPLPGAVHVRTYGGSHASGAALARLLTSKGSTSDG